MNLQYSQTENGLFSEAGSCAELFNYLHIYIFKLGRGGVYVCVDV